MTRSTTSSGVLRADPRCPRDHGHVGVLGGFALQNLRRTNQILIPNVPPTFALIQRINLGLFSLMGKLEATANWRAISEELWVWTDADPTTPLGEAEAAWVASGVSNAAHTHAENAARLKPATTPVSRNACGRYGWWSRSLTTIK